MEDTSKIVAVAEEIVFGEYMRSVAEQDVAALNEACKEQRRKRGQKVIDNLAAWGRSVGYVNLAWCVPSHMYDGLRADPDDSRPGSVH